MSDKYYISADELLQDSFRLGMEVFKSGFKPDLVVGVWRGGTPVGIAVQEILRLCDVHTDHIAIRTASYEGIGRRGKEVHVHGLDYIIKNMGADASLLIVDDVFDTGLSVAAILEALQKESPHNASQDIRIATPWFKPKNNKTNLVPHYFLNEADQWLVFPHELEGLTGQEIQDKKPKVKALLEEYGL